MKKNVFQKAIFLIPLLAISFLSFTSQAQIRWKNDKMKSFFYVQPNIGICQYFGDLNQKDYWSQTPKFGAGVVGGYQLNPLLGVRGQFLKTVLHSEKINQNKQLISDLWDAAFHVTININQIFADYNDKRLLNFYLFTGGGISSFKSFIEIKEPQAPFDKHDKRQYSFFLPVGVGTSVRVNNTFAINLEYGDRTIFDPTRLDLTDGGSENNDHYSYASAGLQIKLGVKDTDGDGVRDKDDLCPTVSGKLFLGGCPDKDNDGVADKDDMCPDISGLAEFKGCPDTDGDQIPDKEDACPGAAGKAELKGCPDKDGDGVADKDDACPDAAGLAGFGGCPDRDGDRVIDKDDACPDVKGLPQLQGCPDTDGDGVPDNKDQCPDVKGILANNGCPEIIAGPLFVKNVYFNSDEIVVTKQNIADLEEVVTFLNTHPGVVVSVAGHADSRESDAYNLRLSEKRADFVINYLDKKGIKAIKVDKSFFGKSKPVADNTTAEGRSLNRRVEIRVTK